MLISRIVREERGIISVMSEEEEKGREKWPLPPEFLDLVELGCQANGWSHEELSRQAGVSNAAISRMFDNLASWDTVLKVARKLDIPVPRVVLGDSIDARLDQLRDAHPERYKMIMALMAPVSAPQRALPAPNKPAEETEHPRDK